MNSPTCSCTIVVIGKASIWSFDAGGGPAPSSWFNSYAVTTTYHISATQFVCYDTILNQSINQPVSQSELVTTRSTQSQNSQTAKK